MKNEIDWTDPRLPRFGEPQPGTSYWPRPGAYGLICSRAGQLAVIHTPIGTFLPGGGQHNGESPEQALRRELREECGRQGRILGYLGAAVEYIHSLRSERYLQIRAQFYRVAFGRRLVDPLEADHSLLWLPPEQAAGQLRPRCQAWAVRQFVLKFARDPRGEGLI